jgi:hypothetical protein
LEPLPKWFRVAASMNPITWQIDWFRYTSIGLGNGRKIMLEGLAFLVFVGASFLFASRALQRQE